MRTYMRVFAVLFAAYAAHAAKIEVVQDHDNALYRAGEEVTFKVSVKSDSGELIKSGRASWKLDNFGTKKLASGKVDLAAGKYHSFALRSDALGEHFSHCAGGACHNINRRRLVVGCLFLRCVVFVHCC